MKMQHTRIQGKTAEISPCCEKQFPNHSAVLCVRMEGKKEPIFMAMHKSQESAIAYCKQYGFDVPVFF